jgi:hypothetical protein
MIRCPNCNSTTQVRKYKEIISTDETEIKEFYSCGCGCWFKNCFERNHNGEYDRVAKIILAQNKDDNVGIMEALLEANADVLERLKNI